MRLLLLGDTHLGFDLPARPRIRRRRRGPEFFAACRRALAPARRSEVDLVVHGGDLLYRSKVPAWLVQQAMEPFFEVADGGVPVFIVPGNHERSRIPYPLLTQHPKVHIFDAPKTFHLELRGQQVRLSGFPFARRVAGRFFQEELAATQWTEAPNGADIKLLCLHQAVEGATVGVQNFTFRKGDDVIAGRDIPDGFAAILSGHIHRAQVLTHELYRDRRLAAPVIYPGSCERTSFAERHETKGYRILELEPNRQGGRLVDQSFVPLPTRPMVRLEIDVSELDPEELEEQIVEKLGDIDPDAVVQLIPGGAPSPEQLETLSAPSLRSLAPRTMNIDVPNRFWRDQ